MARSVVLHYRESVGETVHLEDRDRADHLALIGQELARQYGRSVLSVREDVFLPFVRALCADVMEKLSRDDLEVLGVEHVNEHVLATVDEQPLPVSSHHKL